MCSSDLIAVFNISMPNLLKQKDMAKDDTSFLLYTKDTCNEFHLLLVELLGRFNISVLSDNRPGHIRESNAGLCRF